MKNLLFLIIVFSCLGFASCRNKTVVLLTKKWDCVQVDNIVPPDARFQSKQDSLNSEQLKTLLQSISWTFKKNMRYECAVGSRVTVKGKYQLLEDDKILILTSETKNNINRYLITNLTENEMVLSGSAENTKLVMHFKPN